MIERKTLGSGFARGLDSEMTHRPRRALRTSMTVLAAGLLAIVAVTATTVCGKYEEPTPPMGNTGPGATVGRITILSGPVTITAGDSAYYSAKAFDNAGNELPVTLQWSSSNSLILAINPGTGRAKGVSAGSASIVAFAGSASSPARLVTVNPQQAYP
jgi:hypothetical protein